MKSHSVLFAGFIWMVAGFSGLGVVASRSDLKVDKQSINAGQSAIISWNMKADQKAYILGIGRVFGTGSTEVKPGRSMVYTLVTEGPEGISVRSAAIDVSGSRGQEDGCQRDESRFKYPISFELHFTSLVDLLERVHHVLQDELAFTVDASQTPNKLRFLYVTNCSQRADLVQSAERQIGARRVSYRVELSGPESLNDATSSELNPVRSPQSHKIAVTCKVSTLVEFKRKIESTWRIEDREAIYQMAARDVESRLTRPE
jgi:hypothetical protein